MATYSELAHLLAQVHTQETNAAFAVLAATAASIRNMGIQTPAVRYTTWIRPLTDSEKKAQMLQERCDSLANQVAQIQSGLDDLKAENNKHERFHQVTQRNISERVAKIETFFRQDDEDIDEPLN